MQTKHTQIHHKKDASKLPIREAQKKWKIRNQMHQIMQTAHNFVCLTRTACVCAYQYVKRRLDLAAGPAAK